MIRGAIDYIQGAIAELQHVTWPSRKEVIDYTVIILVSIAIAMLIVSVIDFGLVTLVNIFIIK
jgi:preprotein translocase subunit SecE